MEFANPYAHHPPFESQSGAWSSQNQQQHGWSTSETTNSSLPTVNAAHAPHHIYGTSGAYSSGGTHQAPNTSGALPHTQPTTDALDLAISTHPAHTMSSYGHQDGYASYGAHNASRGSAAYAQHPQAQFTQHPQHGQSAQGHAHPVHPSYSSGLSAAPQQGIHSRRMVSMPSRGMASKPSVPQSAPVATSEFDMNALMQQSIDASAPFTISPGQSPSAMSPPESISVTLSGKGPSSSVGSVGKPKAAKRSNKRKKLPEPEDDGDDDDEDQTGNGKGVTKHACRRCKGQKIRCVPVEGESSCQKCKLNNVPCVYEKRKPPRNPNKREYFLAQIREKDAIIESLLKEKYNPYTATPLSVKSFRETAPPGANAFAFLDKLQDGTKRPTGVSTFTFREPTQTASGSDEEPERSDEDAAEELGSTSKGERDSPLDGAYPVAMLENLQVSNRRRSSGQSNSSAEDTAVEEDNVGPMNREYFTRRPAVPVEQHNRSDLIMHGLVTEADVESLFEIYHTKLNAFIPLLDPQLHTPQETFKRCPPLFTVICAITSRYTEDKKDIYPVAMHFAKNECANALMHGWKSVGLAQAFLLLAMYHNPAKRWEEERAYLYAGLATRIAIDLNLHITPVAKANSTEKEEREVLDRLRLWMICYETDWNMAAHYGKPSSVKENQIIRTSDNFWLQSQYNLVFDIGLSAYNKLLRTVSEFHTKAYSDPDSRTGLNKSIDFRGMCDEFDVKLLELEDFWKRSFADYHAFDKDPINYEIYRFRCSLLPYAVNYCRLVMCCFGFQQTFEKGKQSPDRVFLNRCMTAAKAVVVTFIEVLAPSGFMRYAPNGWFNFCSFACAFLIKLLRTEFSAILRKDEEDGIVALVHQLIETLRTDTVAIDDRHTPKLWARFMEDLLSKKRGESMSTNETHTPTTTQPTGPTPSQHYQSQAGNSVPMYYPSGPSSVPMDYSQWQAAQQAHGVTPAQVTPQPPTQSGMYSAPFQGYAVGQGFYQPGAIPMNVDDESLAITAAIAPEASFWDSMMMPGFVWPDSPQSLADLPDATSAQQQVQVQPMVDLNMQSWYSAAQ